ncbi:MAG: methyltransferase domain-containing protein [Limnobacter sp.]|nr:methyltransferase domain-containing protein [Limnobacter sp.]
MSEAFWKHPRSSEALVRQWERKVSRWSSVPFLLEEVHQRMLTRAEIMRPVEGAVLVQGWMHAQTFQALQGQFSDRVLHLVHPAPWPMAAQPLSPPVADAQGMSSKFKSFLSKIVSNAGVTESPRGIAAVQHAVAAPGADLPVPDASQALVWSPLWLHQINDPRHLMAQWHRVLKPDGGIFFSCFGPDTAKELHGFASALGQRMPDFSDMHDLGDALSRQGFSDPVMEMEKLTLTYADPRKMIAEWRELNANLLLDRALGLKGATALAKAYTKLAEELPHEASRHHLTLELVYGHAWKVQKPKGPQIATVQLSDIGGRKGK